MAAPSWDVLRLVLAAVLALSVLLSLLARPPRQRPVPTQLWRLVAAGTALYIVGTVDSLTHHQRLAALVYAAGIATCARAAWLSRGRDTGGGPPEGSRPEDEQPPPDPDGLPQFDWSSFEAEFRSFAERQRQRVP